MIEVIGLHKQFAENILYNGYNVRFCAPKICIEAPNGQGKTTSVFSRQVSPLLTPLEPACNPFYNADGT